MIRLAALALGAALLALPATAQDLRTQCRDEAQRGLTKACEAAIAKQPRDPALHALLGEAYFASGFYGDGLAALRQAIAMSNGAADYRYRFAGYAALINEYPQAAAELERLVQDNPDHVKAWTLLADCYRYLKNKPQALRAGLRAAELGDAAEAYALGMRYGSGDGVATDPRQELHWLERAANSGYVAAMQELARLHAEGRPGLPPDAAKQRQWEDAARKAMKN
ncbi:MAG: tetratricopeptide repeat protein [Ferrovibrio sp.]|uniref:tetratricopeptide repeat protein n=1 Tax=Ferrovibrio sp. TaxID=1917215 RepID=UPI00391B37BC